MRMMPLVFMNDSYDELIAVDLKARYVIVHFFLEGESVLLMDS